MEPTKKLITPDPTQYPTQGPTTSEPTTALITTTPTVSPTAEPSTQYTMPPIIDSLPEEHCRPLKPSTEVWYWCPILRYCSYDYFPRQVQSSLLRNTLRYNLLKWNYIVPAGTTDTDSVSWSDHPDSVRAGLHGLGFDEERHDCCNSHYGDYDWVDFVYYQEEENYPDLVDALTLYGYNETSWNENWEVEYDDFWWREMPSAVRKAMFDVLCYNEEQWNELPLIVWSDTVTLPGSFPKSEMGNTMHT